MIPEIAQELDAGRVTVETVEQLLKEVYGDEETPEKADNRARVIRDGKIVKFQLVALNSRARTTAAEEAAEAAVPPAVPEELLRDVPEPVYDHVRPDLAAEIKRRVGIIAGVRLWGKPQVRINERGIEGIKVRCPFDSHGDLNPSAWVNTEKGTWYCGKCTVGGDVIDFYAARTRGVRPDEFHKGSDFSEVVTAMGEELGLRVSRDTSGDYFVDDDSTPLPSAAPDPVHPPEPVMERPEPIDVTYGEPDVEGPDGERLAPIPPEPMVPPSAEATEPVTLSEDDMLRGVAIDTYDIEFDFDLEDGEPEVPRLEWRDLDLPDNSFLASWMRVNETEMDWIPPEFFVMLGMQAIGLACGHEMTSKSYGIPLTGSTMLVLAGHSGTGKSTAVGKLRRMITQVTGPKFDPEMGTGIKLLSSPGSAEALVASIKHEIIDPSDGTTKKEVGITTWLFEDEFASLVERSRRRGGGHLKTRIMQLHDFVKWERDPEVVIDEFSLTSGRRLVHDTFFSGCFLTQPDAVASLTEHVDLVSGFLNRMIPVFGASRTRRLAADESIIDPDPPYHGSYRELWMRCRYGPDMIPFQKATLDLIDSHPFFEWTDKATQLSSMYARLAHHTLRFAFLLAVNDGSKEITPAHLETATIIGYYLQKCIVRLIGQVLKLREDECADQIVQFVQKWYRRKGEWPSKRNWGGDRQSYREFTGPERQAAMEMLIREERLVEVSLTKGKAKLKVLIVPENDWASYSSAHGKTFKWEDVYGVLGP